VHTLARAATGSFDDMMLPIYVVFGVVLVGVAGVLLSPLLGWAMRRSETVVTVAQVLLAPLALVVPDLLEWLRDGYKKTGPTPDDDESSEAASSEWPSADSSSADASDPPWNGPSNDSGNDSSPSWEPAPSSSADPSSTSSSPSSSVPSSSSDPSGGSDSNGSNGSW
jgi:hypothetical protein